VGTGIPDNDSVGVADNRTVSGTSITSIDLITVTLNITGGWNGDLYAYLVHDTGFSVLLNRPGRTLATPDGSASSGMVVTLEDAAATDIHTGIPMSGGSFTATFQPDGRNVDPLVVLDTTPRTAPLSSFNGLSADGGWTLFVADQSPGSTSTLASWTLNISGIPEPGSTALCGVAAALLLRRRRR
jgi:subtilisin-like proprotein convertase family protein